MKADKIKAEIDFFKHLLTISSAFFGTLVANVLREGGKADPVIHIFSIIAIIFLAFFIFYCIFKIRKEIKKL